MQTLKPSSAWISCAARLKPCPSSRVSSADFGSESIFVDASQGLKSLRENDHHEIESCRDD
jgi:hypothetical protein